MKKEQSIAETAVSSLAVSSPDTSEIESEKSIVEVKEKKQQNINQMEFYFLPVGDQQMHNWTKLDNVKAMEDRLIEMGGTKTKWNWSDLTDGMWEDDDTHLTREGQKFLVDSLEELALLEPGTVVLGDSTIEIIAYEVFSSFSRVRCTWDTGGAGFVSGRNPFANQFQAFLQEEEITPKRTRTRTTLSPKPRQAPFKKPVT